MSPKKQYVDQEIINMIRSGGKDFEMASNHLFQAHLGYISKISQKLNLPLELTKDAYTDAIVKLIRQIKQGSFQQKSKISSYFYSIFHNTSVDYLRKHTSNKIIKADQELHEFSTVESDLLKQLETKDDFKHLMVKINQLGDSCRKILMDWGYYGYSMEEIAERNHLSNAKSATSMKYKCLQQLKKIVKENS